MNAEKNLVTANLIDINGDGKIDMISFMNNKGSVGLAVDNKYQGSIDQIYIFQDVTGDGVLDQDDEIRLREKANELLTRYIDEEPQQLSIEL
ncbi:MAG: hypothetical protein HQM13_16105 [SAR324 cluster bacterium]|nr:hypothetical protein [SAR324 cluster bacterium]